ncbi:MAG: 50S ribosomal protein L31e [Thermoplasmata archaeon]|nr:50S ribosomal protein L31e [Thermoplasmata archaeon]
MAEDERIYTVSLRGARTIPSTKRAQWAMTKIKEFVASHVKDHDRIWIDPEINKKLWARGKKKAPSSVRIRVIRFEDDLVEVSLPEEE